MGLIDINYESPQYKFIKTEYEQSYSHSLGPSPCEKIEGWSDIYEYHDTHRQFCICDFCNNTSGYINEGELSTVHSRPGISEYFISITINQETGKKHIHRYSANTDWLRRYACNKCFKKIKPLFPEMLDVMLLKTAVSKLKGVINEVQQRDQDDWRPETCTCRCCKSGNQWRDGYRKGQLSSQTG